MKVYVSGPMTGIPDWNFPAFAAATADLRVAGNEVISPAELNPETGGQWSDYLRRDLVALVECDAIAMLPGWTGSKGARLEYFVAAELGMQVVLLAGAEAEPAAPKALTLDLVHEAVCNEDKRWLEREHIPCVLPRPECEHVFERFAAAAAV